MHEAIMKKAKIGALKSLISKMMKMEGGKKEEVLSEGSVMPDGLEPQDEIIGDDESNESAEEEMNEGMHGDDDDFREDVKAFMSGGRKMPVSKNSKMVVAAKISKKKGSR